MFRNFVTYSFAQNFHFACRELELAAPVKDRLLRSADCMLEHFSKSVRVSDRKQELAALFVTLTCLRDCRDTLEETGSLNGALLGRYEYLHARLEQLCLDRAANENGQLRMFG